MNVLQIANGYLSQKLYANMFSCLEKLNINNTVYVPINKKCDIIEQKTSKYKLLISPIFSDVDRILFFTKHRKMYSDLVGLVDLNSIDVIHAHTLFSGGFLAYKLNRIYGVPYIVAIRNTDINLFMKYMVHLRFIGRKILNNAQKIIFISPIYQKRFIEKYISLEDKSMIYKKSNVVPNGIDDYWLNNIYTTQRIIDSKNIKLIFVGTICTNKGILPLIKTCECLKNRGYNIQVIMIGKMENTKYQNIINKYSFIKYLGFLTKEEILRYMRESDIFILPSRTETFGLVYAEAMSQGLPVIYTRGEGFDGQFSEGEVGFSASWGNIDSIVEGILASYNNYQSISRNCINNVHKFDWNYIASSYRKMYDEITK